MKKIYLNLITLILFVGLNQDVFSQKIFDQMSKEICGCLKKEKVKNPESMTPCIENTLIENLKNLKEFYKVESVDKIDMELVGLKIGNSLMKECDYVLENFISEENKFDKDFQPNENLDCQSLKSGDFYYLNANMSTSKKDTTYFTIKDKMFLERMNQGRTYSMLNIEWLDKCSFELEFKNSNDPVKRTMSQPGDKYKYDIVSTSENSYTLKLFWQNQEYKIEFFKSK